ncbi:MAG: Na+:solute symporter, partial [Verrucomicrobiales bacterium]|nr:Na+:solute symporter [Verrucomicrobiales bacterium]
MRLHLIDWLVIGAFFALYVVIGVMVAKKAGQNFQSYFLGDRKMSWWLLGFSMVATTFATDTPNLVTNIVRTSAVYGNWQWWGFLLSGLTTVFFFAKLWRRSGVLTDIEFNELRYSGQGAAMLRGFRAVYLGVIFNTIIMANVTLAAIKIGAIMLGLSPLQSILIAALITAAYSSAGGLTGVLLTDLVQFVVAMVGSVGAALFVVQMPEVGGWAQLLQRPEVQALTPALPSLTQTPKDVLIAVFLLPLAVQWWATYYPGAEPGGGGYVVQRILSARDERHAAGATLLFNLMHYAIRPWPWIVVALASMAVFPTVESIKAKFPNVDATIVGHDLAYPAMLTFLPAGLLGLVVASLIAAY